MPKIKTILQMNQNLGSVSAAGFGTAYPLAGALTLSAQINVTGVSSPNTASAILQFSDDPEDVTPTNFTDKGSAQNVTATGSLYFQEISPGANWARFRFAITSGSYDANSNFVVKGPN